MSRPTTPGLIAARRLALSGLVAVALLVPTPAPGAPEGQLTWAVHVSVVSNWLDQGGTAVIRTQLRIRYALHGGLVKPMEGSAMARIVGGSCSAFSDRLVCEVVPRHGG